MTVPLLRLVLDVNPATEDLTGYTRDELLAMGGNDLAAPDQPEDAAAILEAFLPSGAGEGTFRLRRKDGRILTTEYRAVANIQPGVHLSILRDVTARNDMVQQLREREHQFRELAENATDIVAQLRFDIDTGMHIDYVNPAAVDILGYPLERFYADPDLLFHLFEDPEAVRDALSNVPTVETAMQPVTVRVRRQDGAWIWLETKASLSDPGTQPVTVQIVARDITARRATLEALEQALRGQKEAADELRVINAMKDTFLQSVSHEIRTPVTSIVGFAELLASTEQPLSGRQTTVFHERILDNARRLRRLVDDMLDVARFVHGRLEPRRSPTELSELIRRVVDESELGDHPISLGLEPLTCAVDGPWIERIVHNLLRNVVQHTPPATRIWVRLSSTADDVQMTVDDDGPGIPEADRVRVLQPFQQGSETAASASPGTGMGLALVEAATQMHGGRVLLDERPDGGTRVTVVFPLVAPADMG